MSSKSYSKAYSQYGASMGRREFGRPDLNELCNLHKVPLDNGGYDPGGAYWGTGVTLWRLQYNEGQRFVRAYTRFQAFLKLMEWSDVEFRVRP